VVVFSVTWRPRTDPDVRRPASIGESPSHGRVAGRAPSRRAAASAVDGPGPQPGNPGVLSVRCVQIAQNVRESGRYGRSGCCPRMWPRRTGRGPGVSQVQILSSRSRSTRKARKRGPLAFGPFGLLRMVRRRLGRAVRATPPILPPRRRLTLTAQLASRRRRLSMPGRIVPSRDPDFQGAARTRWQTKHKCMVPSRHECSRAVGPRGGLEESITHPQGGLPCRATIELTAQPTTSLCAWGLLVTSRGLNGAPRPAAGQRSRESHPPRRPARCGGPHEALELSGRARLRWCRRRVKTDPAAA
jgi:hypothetical protein